MHICTLQNYQNFPKPRTIRGANKGTFNALGTGDLKLMTQVEGKSIDIHLKDTLYAPKIAFTLISIGRCDDAGYRTEFAHQKCVIKSATGKVLLQAPKLDGQRYIKEPILPIPQCHRSSQEAQTYLAEDSEPSVETWHDIRYRTQFC